MDRLQWGILFFVLLMPGVLLAGFLPGADTHPLFLVLKVVFWGVNYLLSTYIVVRWLQQWRLKGMPYGRRVLDIAFVVGFAVICIALALNGFGVSSVGGGSGPISRQTFMGAVFLAVIFWMNRQRQWG